MMAHRLPPEEGKRLIQPMHLSDQGGSGMMQMLFVASELSH